MELVLPAGDFESRVGFLPAVQEETVEGEQTPQTDVRYELHGGRFEPFVYPVI